ncbi:ribosome-inactivating family protein [Paraburkholderia sp. MMS20-SJTR3]|uniref:Ribosome-inactivating family protein n=1 Tax=Paraburkholderia sejongensis TaxID=2886946 RepID=A0ABS8K684_9BURK|nr:ribosome-inactivating family protein [Paraburkholderia sp. MMS20-SJTR3]MCC8397658.1 ribosome-inactivating family protein [Paraburkholderia sp. MMS20-SJTR3]
MSEALWCVHIIELNDFIATSSKDAAEAESAAINAHINKAANSTNTSICRAVATRWPFSPASHMRSLEVDWGDLERMPHKL